MYSKERPRGDKTRFHKVLPGWGDFPAVLPILFLGIFFYIPLFTALTSGFLTQDGLTLEFLRQAIFSNTPDARINRYYLQFTLTQAVVSTIFAVVIGLPGAYYFSHYEFPGRKGLQNLMIVPFVLPAIVVVLGFVILLGPQGFVNKTLMNLLSQKTALIDIEGSFEGIILVHAFYNAPIVIRIVSAVWEREDPDMESVAATLGCTGFQKFRKITLPQILPGILASALLTFLYCFTSFAVVLSLGGILYRTLEVRIYSLTVTYFEYEQAAVLASLQLILTALIIAWYLREMGSRSIQKGGDLQVRKTEVRPLLNLSETSVKSLITFLGYFILLSLFFFGPIISIIYSSFTDRNTGIFTLSGYQEIFSDYSPFLHTTPFQQILNTLVFSIGTLIISTILGTFSAYCIARGKLLNKENKLATLFSIGVLLPIAVSSITLALGILKTYYNSFIMTTETWIAILAAHVLVAFPFVNRTVSAAYEKLGKDLLDIPATLGASRLRIFLKVELPMIAPGIIAGALFSFAISVGEFGATYFLARPQFTTMAIGVYQFLDMRRYQASAAMATILIVFCVLSFIAIEKLGESEIGF